MVNIERLVLSRRVGERIYLSELMPDGKTLRMPPVVITITDIKETKHGRVVEMTIDGTLPTYGWSTQRSSGERKDGGTKP